MIDALNEADGRWRARLGRLAHDEVLRPELVVPVHMLGGREGGGGRVVRGGAVLPDHVDPRVARAHLHAHVDRRLPGLLARGRRCPLRLSTPRHQRVIIGREQRRVLAEAPARARVVLAELDEARRPLHLRRWRRVNVGVSVRGGRCGEPADQRLRRLHSHHRRLLADVRRAERPLQPLGAPQHVARLSRAVGRWEEG